MDYDEKYFKISANKKALRMWVIIGLALTGAYIAECVKGARTVPYTVLFCFVCWVPFVFTYIFIKIKGWDCIFRKNRALAPHERSAVPLGTDHCPVG